MGDLQFIPATHTYLLNGQALPSVTQVLKETRLVDYSMIPQDVLQWAAARGTAVHEACQFFDEGDLDEEALDPVIRPYLEAYKHFKRDADFRPELIEHRVSSEAYRFAGTLDRTGTMRGATGRSPVVLDFKSGIVLPGHALQLAAYQFCLPKSKRFRRIALQLKADGTYKVHEFSMGDYDRDISIFLGALACVHWRGDREAELKQKEREAKEFYGSNSPAA